MRLIAIFDTAAVICLGAEEIRTGFLIISELMKILFKNAFGAYNPK